MLKTYDYLQKINFGNLYSSKSENEIFEKLKNISKDLSETLSEDFKIFSNEKALVKELKIEFDNPNYKQSATGIIQEINFENEENFKIFVDILIDFNRVLISPKGEAQNKTLKNLDKKIKSKYNIELKTELKEIL